MAVERQVIIPIAVGWMAISVFVSFSLPANSSGQEFRPPTIQTGTQVPKDPGTADPSTSNQDAFVPENSGRGLGLTPVSPRSQTRNAGNGGSVLEKSTTGTDSGRNVDDERIISILRSGKFDEATVGEEMENGTTVIRQRYPDGTVQVLRHVAQDKEGNFYNHGPWQTFNQKSEVIAKGQFEYGLMDGAWERWHAIGSDGLFATKPFNLFTGPFLSKATFVKGELDGVWAMYDHNQRKIFEIPYKNGKRHGTATWWYPTSEKMREISFRDGIIDGPLYEWNDQDQLVRNDEYIQGQKVLRNITFYRPQQKQTETFFLDAPLRLEGSDSWWHAKPAEYVETGHRVQHGPSTAWHENGQPKMRGQYKNGVRVGAFQWWHLNGQRSLAGIYDSGLKVGTWTWWHENGFKAIQGDYENDQPTGEWIWWDEDGTVSSRKNFSETLDSTGELVQPVENGEEQDQSGPNSSPPDSPVPGASAPEEIRPIEDSEPANESQANSDDDSKSEPQFESDTSK
jgi:antitoxin component YwqK of YwqJK toxin-antitoxin module